MNIDEITRIAELMTAHNLTEFVVESQDIKLSLKRSKDEIIAAAAAAIAAPMAQSAEAAPLKPVSAPDAVPARKTFTIDSPIVGTFYAAPSPDAPPFIKVGDEVREESVICIVEAMKVMNEVKAEKRGRVIKILVENAKPVEFGQPLFELEAV